MVLSVSFALGFPVCSDVIHLAVTKIVKQHNEILMTAKAYNNRVILEWLADVLREAHVQAADPRVRMMFLAMILGRSTYCLNLCGRY